MEAEKLSYVIIPVLVVAIGMTGFFLSDGASELDESVQIENSDFFGIKPDTWKNMENEVLDPLEGREEIDFVNELENMKTLVYPHRYSTGGPTGPSATEYIVMVSSVGVDKSRTAVFRMSYENKDILGSYTNESEKSEDLSIDDVITKMENQISKFSYHSTGVITENDIKKIGPNYIYIYPAGDFGGTIIVNEYTGEPIFYATTIWNGTGQVIIPEELSRNSEKAGGENISVQPV